MLYKITLPSLLLSLLFFTSGTYASTDTLVVVFGVVKNIGTGDTLTQYTVVATDAADPAHMVQGTVSNGRYELNLMEVRTYRITYSAAGHIPKVVEVQMAGPSEEDWNGGYGMHVDVLLLDQSGDVDGALFNEPFGISRFNSASGNFEWDQEHTRKMRARQAALLEEKGK